MSQEQKELYDAQVAFARALMVEEGVELIKPKSLRMLEREFHLQEVARTLSAA